MLDRTIQAVPAIYDGVLFRSSLEAKWAAFFDLLGIEWEYEPTTIPGWMPDFLVGGWWLAEVKPVPMTNMGIIHEPEFRKAIRPFDTLFLGDGPGDALGLLVRWNDDEVFPRYLIADVAKRPADLVAVPFMLPGYNFGLTDIWTTIRVHRDERDKERPSRIEKVREIFTEPASTVAPVNTNAT
jgi:hypothetical protein